MLARRVLASVIARRGLMQSAIATQTLTRNYTSAAIAVQDNTMQRSKDPRLTAMKDITKKEKDMVVFKDISVKQILEHKSGGQLASVATVTRSDTVYNAIKKMNSVRVGALVVTDEQGKPVGMISERDYLNKVVLRGFSSKEITVNDIMTSDIVTITADVTAGDCMEMMTQGRFRHLPVVDTDNKMIGIISIGDLVKTVLDQQKETITFLKEYIERTY